jgi:hypothetical protein
MAVKTDELKLLLACARTDATEANEAAIRQMLLGEIDWTLFARKAIDHGLASLAGYTLGRLAPDAVPEDILSAFRTIVDQTRRKNRALFDELASVISALSSAGIEAIPLKGPVLAIQSYDDLGLRVFRDLDFLIRDPDLAATITVLHELGYKRKGQLSAHQFDLIHRLQGQEILFKEEAGNAV